MVEAFKTFILHLISYFYALFPIALDEEQKKKKPKKRKYRFLRIIARILAVLLILFVVLVLFIRSPWGQNIIVQKAVKYVSDKTHTKVEIEKFFLTFDGNLMLKGLYLEDQKGDTLVYSKSLEANLPLISMIRGNGYGVDYLEWEGLRANIIRKDSVQGYNFQFLMDAFATADTTAVATDTTSAPLNIVLGELNFKDFDITFNDAVLGIDSQFKIGALNLQMDKTDLENFDFRASNASISNSRIKYIQSPIPVDPNAPPVPLPYLVVEKLKLNNVFVDYQSYGDRIAADLAIIDLYAEMPKIDLANNDIEIGDLDLKNSIIKINTETENNGLAKVAVEAKDKIVEDIQKFEWPDFKIAIDNIDFEKNNIEYFVGNAEVKKDIFNPNAIALSNLNLRANSIFLKDKKAGLQLDSFTFVEGSGLNLKELAANLQATDTNLDLTDLALELNNNKLEGKLLLEYTSLADLVEKPDKSKIDLDIPSFQVDLKEAFKFQPDLKKNEYLRTLSKKYLTGKAKASGYLSAIQIPILRVNWGSTTQIAANGLIKNATNPDNLAFNIPTFSANTKRSDLIQFVSEKDLGVSLPNDVKLKGSAKGNVNDVYAKANLTTSQGIAIIDGHFKNGAQLEFDADLEIKDYKLNELLQNDQLGSLSLKLTSTGKGKTINNLDAVLDATISDFQYNNYAIKDLAINGKINNGKGNIASKYKDENINLDFNADVKLDSVAPTASAHLNVIGLNLQAVGLMKRDVRTALKFDADFEGNKDGFDVISTIGDGVVVYDDTTYLLGDVLATAHVRSDTTSIWLDNKIVKLQLESNADPATFASAVQRHIQSYFTKNTKIPDSIKRPVKLDIRGQIIQAPVLNKVFLVNVKELDTVTIVANFDEKARKLNAFVKAPHINYGGNKLDSLAFTMDTDKEKFVFDLGFENVEAGPLHIPKTKITGRQENSVLNLLFNATNKDSTVINVRSQITGPQDRLVYHVLADSLIFNSHNWAVPENNEIVITDKNLEFNNFNFTYNDQIVEITDKLPNVKENHVAIDFQNFKLSEILNYLNPEKQLATGILNGDFVVENPFGNTGLLADLKIEQLNMLNTNLGILTLNAKPIGGNSYDFNLALKEGEVDLDLTGDYIANTDAAKLNLDLDINKFNMKALEGFSLGELKNASGSFSGNFDVSGTTTDPIYNGDLNFNDAAFTVTMLNAPFTLENESIKIDNKGLSMNNFTVRDENNNTFIASGTIGTESFVNPTFDLDLKADNFQVLNATKEDNDFLYGKAAFNATAKLTGDLEIPKLDMDLTVTNDTDVTYVMPASAVAIESRDGVVIFVNRENPDAILTKSNEESGVITGFDVNALLKLGKAAKIKVIIDKETGDNFQVYGDGDLDFTINPNGRMTLSGVYEIEGGSYEMNLYNLVNRKFDLKKGSRVTWSGDPFDASLDVSAIYNIETSASALMAPISSNSDPSVKGKYREVLPFLVYLNVDGDLTAPEISFNLDMPEDDQGAIGGQVYGRLQQVNAQEGELNRQVFSLLVLSRFYPEPGSDGSGGGFASIARDNINDALSDQLNTFSDKLLGNSGIDLDFGLKSYTDYQGDSPQDRTQLDIAAQKKLFNDRLIVRVGSEVDLQGSSSTNEPTPLVGNVSLEYLLTENGRYRLRGFRKNQFENVIDGQTIVSGIALIFTQEFNQFDELWQAILRGETEKEKADRKAAKEKIKAKEEENLKNTEKAKVDSTSQKSKNTSEEK